MVVAGHDFIFRFHDPVVGMDLIPRIVQGLAELGCMLSDARRHRYPALQHNHLQQSPAGRSTPARPTKKVQAAAPLVRLCPDSSRATGRKSRLPSGFDAESRNILPANRIPPFFAKPFFRSVPSPAFSNASPHSASVKAPADAAALIGFFLLDAGPKGRAHRRRASGGSPDNLKSDQPSQQRYRCGIPYSVSDFCSNRKAD